MKYHKLAIFIAIILFFIPFFWLNLGEMNLGGDAGRLYFYDPLSFLKNYALYNFVAAGKGSESGGFVFFPFTFTLYLLKFIFTSPTTLIAIFNGVILSLSFLSIYFIVRELLETEKSFLKKRFIASSSIVAGLFYIFSQELMNAGWETPILTHNQIFLNPLMFLLIFKYVLTRNYSYIIAACLVSLIFSANFSFIGSPTFFAFYPLSLAFVFFYIKYVRKIQIPYKGLAIGLVFFLCLHAFHLIPEALDVFSLNSANNKAVFLTGGASSRGGLEYFVAIAGSTKVSLSWLGVAQFQNDPKYAIFILFPFVLLGGFLFNKGKTLLVTGIFFLIALFFATANITDIGFTFYKLLFKIPGFSMFRNFHGQWSYVFIFFYTLLFGQALAIIARNLRVRVGYFFIGSFFLILVISGIPLMNGSIPMPRHMNGLRYAFRMDPVYEEVLGYFKRNPVDSKILSLPLTGPSYQVLQGSDEKDNVYQGLPIVSYIVGRGDFVGFGSLEPYSDLFLNYIKNKDYDGIMRILSIMNIHQVFYNSDPFIYSDSFQGYLYAHVSDYNPKTQTEYKSFIEKLSIDKKITYGDKYNIYTLKPDVFLPHIFATTQASSTNEQVDFSTDLYFNKDLRAIPVSIVNTVNKDSSMLFGFPSTFLSKLTENLHLHKREPFISISLDDPRYPFVVLKEKFELYRVRNNSINYLELNLLFLSKRIAELNKFGQILPLYKTWQEPRIWEIYKGDAYRSWEASLARYQTDTEELIDWVSSRNDSDILKEADRVIINEQLFNDQLSLLRSLRSMNRKNSEKKYLVSLTNTMFEKLFQKINVPIYNSSQYYYVLPGHIGDYSVYVEKGDTGIDLTTASISINKDVLKPLWDGGESALKGSPVQFDNYSLKTTNDTKLTLNILPNNVVKNATWNNPGVAAEIDKIQTLTVKNNIDEDTKGFMLDIPTLEEKKTYLISFDYLTEGDNFTIAFFDRIKTKDELRNITQNMYFEKILNSKSWKFHQSIVTTREDVNGAFLRLLAFENKQSSKLSMKNLSVTKIEYPQLILTSVKNNSRSENRAPHITFTKINPTKYSVKVEGAKNPYALVFLESFNNNWSLIDTSRDDESVTGSLLRFAGFLGKNLVGIFVKDDLESTDIVKNYFNGEVKEANHKNIFMSPSTFETWGKRNIAQGTHSEAFGYANVWLINPEDMQERSEYTLIIEMKNQKRFYIFGFVSTITLAMIIICCVKKVFFNRAKNNK